MTYNTRRGIFGAISLARIATYHTFNIDYDTYKGSYNLQLMRKSKFPTEIISSNST